MHTLARHHVLVLLLGVVCWVALQVVYRGVTVGVYLCFNIVE